MVKFREDIIVATDDGKMYKFTEADISEYEIDPADPHAAPVIGLLKEGVSVAAVPLPEEEEGPHARGDFYCYLLNLSGLRQTNPWEE